MQRVFVSAPMDDGLTSSQKIIKGAIIDMLAAAGLDPQLFGVRGIPIKMSWSFDHAEEVMSRCSGAVVIALARHRYPARGGPPVRFASEYNHYEGALALSMKLPVLILREAGVPDRGIVYRGGGQFIVRVPNNAKPAWLETKAFKPYFKVWLKHVGARRDVFFGYCSTAQSTATVIKDYLRDVARVSVMDWALDFDPGPSILTKIAEAAEKCQCGVFLFTKDDKLAGKNKKAAPRDNVVFEAGYFLHARGPNRVLIVREEGAKLPADLGGQIYANLANRKDVSSIHPSLASFCAAALDRKKA